MIIDYRPDAAPNTAKLSGDQKNYPQLFNDLYSPHNFSIDFSIAMCYIVFWKGQWLKSRRLNIHTEVTLWLLLLPTSACPAAHAQHSALLKLSLWAIFTMRSMPTSALSAVRAQLSAPQRQSRAKSQSRKNREYGSSVLSIFSFLVAHWGCYGYGYCGIPTGNIGINHSVSHPVSTALRFAPHFNWLTCQGEQAALLPRG